MDERNVDAARTGTTRDQSETEVKFACNICIHTATNPVSTACGHLFCWRCLYEWLQGQTRPCPVCRADLIQGVNIIPLYNTDGSVRSGAATTEPSTRNCAETAATAFIVPQRPHPPSPDRMRPIPLRSPPGQSTPPSPTSPRMVDAARRVAAMDRVVRILDDLIDNDEIFRERVDQLGRTVEELVRDYLGSVRQNMELREQIDRMREQIDTMQRMLRAAVRG